MDIGQINKLADFERILLYYDFKEVTQGYGKMRACCKLHDGNKPTSFEVDLEKKLWYCHSGCKTGGNAVNLIQQLEGCDFFSACHLVASISGFRIGDVEFKQRDMEDAQKVSDWFSGLKPKRIQFDRYRLSNYPTRIISEYRTLSRETLQDARVAFYPIYPLDGDVRLYNRIAFPLIIKNAVVGVSLRSTGESDQIKWTHLPRGFKKNNFLYNYDECTDVIGKSGIYEVIVVEGILDCLKMKQAGIHNVVAVLGSTISAAQLTLLMKVATSIVLCFDGDDAGVQSRNKYIRQFKSIFDVFYMDLGGGADPHSLTEEEINRLYTNKIRVQYSE